MKALREIGVKKEAIATIYQIQLVSLGMIGEYIGRLFLQHSKEPQFLVTELVGYDEERRG